MRKMRPLIAALLLAGCGSNGDKSGTPKETDAEQAAAAKNGVEMGPEEFVSRTPNAPHYVRPPRDPAIIWKGIDGRIALVDTRTGDYFHAQTTDRERRLSDYRFFTKNGKLVCIFMTQDGSGTYAKKWKQFPIRVVHIEEAKIQSPEVRAARKRISIKRFAEFLTADPDFADNPSSQFVVIDAPVSAKDPV